MVLRPAVVGLLALSAACSFETRSDEFACIDGSDCESGSVCSQGWCVVEECPVPCDNCSGTTCFIDCSDDGACASGVVCPSGFACDVDCDGANACAAGVDCTNATACDIDCDADGACNNGVACGSGPCNVDCSSDDACVGGINCSAACECNTDCDGINSCAAGSMCPNPGQCTDGLGCDGPPGQCKTC